MRTPQGHSSPRSALSSQRAHGVRRAALLGLPPSVESPATHGARNGYSADRRATSYLAVGVRRNPDQRGGCGELGCHEPTHRDTSRLAGRMLGPEPAIPERGEVLRSSCTVRFCSPVARRRTLLIPAPDVFIHEMYGGSTSNRPHELLLGETRGSSPRRGLSHTPAALPEPWLPDVGTSWGPRRWCHTATGLDDRTRAWCPWSPPPAPPDNDGGAVAGLTGSLP